MKRLQFKCTLLTDVILNVKSASEGANSTLDFIPGNCFLGIVAGELYERVTPSEAMRLFHDGHVRFGDAHPTMDNIRGLRIPASFYYAKGYDIYDNCYIHHFITNSDKIYASNGAKTQLKQSRTGFYRMDALTGVEITTKKSFALKSAYDIEERRSKEGAIYGYEYLSKGLQLLFTVETDYDDLADKIAGALLGERRIGRSRTAQYGMVRIEKCEYSDVESYEDSSMLVVYADSRLIFLDENGQPTYRPTVEHLLGKGARGEISWKDCQIRTFQYSPWNYKRQCYDTDRCGIEKGSVIVINGVDKAYKGACYCGCYQNEGFGNVIFNPIFMQAGGDNGLAKCRFVKHNTAKEVVVSDNDGHRVKATSTSPLFKYLFNQARQKEKNNAVYKNVNEWEGAKLFVGKESFASQWGAIRSIALQYKDNDKIEQAVKEYINHGVKAENWYGSRAKVLEKFMRDNKASLWAAIINLASEMAKKSSKR